MAISSYTELQAAGENWLARSDLSSRIPEFIALCEAKLNRDLRCRQMEQRSTATVDMDSDEPEFITLPSDFQTMRRIRLSSVAGKPRLTYLSPTQIDEYRSAYGDSTGQPLYFSIVGDELELLPTPDDDYTLELIYRKNIPALSSNSNNWLLLLAPDIYLYGMLLEAAPYIKEDERINTWSLGFRTALEGLNRLSMDSQYGSGPLEIRLSAAAP